MKLLVGLGNPGAKYEQTRHNVGWRVLDELARRYDGRFQSESRWKAEVAEVMIGSEKVLLVKPQTFMNLSGEAVRAVLDFYKLTAADVTIIYDDKDVTFGVVRLRSEGSAGGHNGVKSVIKHIGADGFARVRIGVADEESPITDTADFVLARFTTAEEEVLPKVVRASADACEEIIRSGLDKQSHKDIAI